MANNERILPRLRELTANFIGKVNAPDYLNISLTASDAEILNSELGSTYDIKLLWSGAQSATMNGIPIRVTSMDAEKTEVYSIGGLRL